MNTWTQDGRNSAITPQYILNGVAKVQKQLCDDTNISYTEEDTVQNALADGVLEALTHRFDCAGDLAQADITLPFESFAQTVVQIFSSSPFACESLTHNFPYGALFAPSPRKVYTAMGMTDGGRIRLRYTVKRPKEAVRPGNIPNENRMTMANYENEVGVVSLRGRVLNPQLVQTAKAIINDPDPNALPEAVPIGQVDDWLTVRHACGKLKKFDDFTSYYDNIHNVDIYDSLLPGWTKLKKWMKCTDPNLQWFRIKTSTGVNRLFTIDHPLPIKEGSICNRIPIIDVRPGMVMYGCRTDRVSGARRAIEIEVAEHKAVSHDLIPPIGYDVETESDRFDIDTIVTHNCRTRSIV